MRKFTIVLLALAACGPSQEDVQRSLDAKSKLDTSMILLQVYSDGAEKCAEWIREKSCSNKRTKGTDKRSCQEFCKETSSSLSKQFEGYKQAEDAYVAACRKCATAEACELDRQRMERKITQTSTKWTPCVK
jgi:hypothetical protein